MLRQVPWRPQLAGAVAGVVALVAVVVVVVALLSTSFHRWIRDHASRVSLRYAQTFVSHAPQITHLFDGQALTPQLHDQLRALRSMGDVFRFKLFASDGRLLLLSDHLDQPDPLATTRASGQWLGQHHAAGEAMRHRVLAGGTYIEIKRSRGQPDRPPLYTEAYVPLQAQGRTLGVIEVYVDATATAARQRQALAEVAMTVAVAIGILALAFATHLSRRERAKRKVDQQVRYLAEHDALSGALNRASFHRRLDAAVAEAGPGGADSAGFAVLCIDLDRFKEVNDAHGHTLGDEVLREATRRLTALLRHGDALARLGGDEFAILQHGVHSATDVQALGERVVQALALPYRLADVDLQCAGSVGAARFGVEAHSAEELLHKADVALYRAKNEGRARFSFYDSTLDAQLEERRRLVQELRGAVERAQGGHPSGFSLHYQPLHAANGHTVVGYEALMRWTHPTRGMISPAQFIPLAEDIGLIEPLGRWALLQACEEAMRWPGDLAVSVNLSAAQFRGDGDLVAVVAAALQATGLAPARLQLEITESLLMSDTEAVIGTLTRLSQLGVAIAMDDFGTGYSSLAYLWRFPFDKLKIDRAFTRGLQDDERVALIVRSIVALAHAMGIRVNAEGVETPEQMAALQQMGCDELQGFLLGRPGPAPTLKHSPAPRAPAAQALVA